MGGSRSGGVPLSPPQPPLPLPPRSKEDGLSGLPVLVGEKGALGELACGAFSGSVVRPSPAWVGPNFAPGVCRLARSGGGTSGTRPWLSCVRHGSSGSRSERAAYARQPGNDL